MSFRIGNITGTNLPTEYVSITTSGLGVNNGNLGLNVNSGTLNVRQGSDVVVKLGIANVGYVGFSNYAGFAHYQRSNSGDYAMIHESGGNTFINCAPGNDINFRCNNSDKAS